MAGATEAVGSQSILSLQFRIISICVSVENSRAGGAAAYLKAARGLWDFTVVSSRCFSWRLGWLISDSQDIATHAFRRYSYNIRPTTRASRREGLRRHEASNRGASRPPRDKARRRDQEHPKLEGWPMPAPAPRPLWNDFLVHHQPPTGAPAPACWPVCVSLALPIWCPYNGFSTVSLSLDSCVPELSSDPLGLRCVNRANVGFAVFHISEKTRRPFSLAQRMRTGQAL